MPVGEIYVKLIVGFPRDPKVRALARYGVDGILARDLYVQMLLYCKENYFTDGFVPAEEVGVLAYPLPADHANQLAKQLASVGLTKELSKDEAGGWEVLAFVRRNGTKEDVERLSRLRAEAGRTGGAKSRKKPVQRATKATGKQVGYQVAEQNGSNTVSVSVSENRDRDRDIQEPTVPAGEALDAQVLTEGQRSKRLTDAYAEAEPMCKWPAVNTVVLSAIRSGRFTDDEIRAGLLRLAAEGRSVTIDSLRTEMRGFGGGSTSRQSTTDQRVADAQALKARIASRNQEPA